MISVYKIKPKFQNALSPILKLLHKWNISANQITISSILLSLCIGIFFWFADFNTYFFLALPIGLFIRMALNALDGMMARTYNQQSKIGEVLNEIGDVISDILIFFPLLKFESEHIYLIVIFLCLGIINEFSGFMGKVISNIRRYDGPMGKSDRALIIGIYGIISFIGINFSNYTFYIFMLINLLLVISTITRIKRALDYGKDI
ncbi:MAG TPA: CDP-alcohol phosphatidyltransferase family protein [Paludibacteraceae bacterium]|jgi:CDP-diacylglycerol--glycerol-3-phosphate 3-phosphatidyltransferase|nr:CDP-alcohol phosphatidyltransferase family protein [Paludibacteraceae bacterium]HOH74664.1 CDP-alcohol phosphatidyltransferase family protein [Paludibacteraceae bacterium]